MKREELEELHYIAPIDNVPSILKGGILSHRCSRKIEHHSIANPEIQERRKQVVVPGGQPLHKYANLYFCARNPMMYLRKQQHQSLCVLRVATDVLDLSDVVITDQNAASDYVRFGPAPDALEFVDYDKVFAEYWTHADDYIAALRHKSIKCAEVLVPNRVEPHHIHGAYISCPRGRAMLSQLAPTLPLKENPHLFFRA